MTDRPIIFSAAMVCALHAGRKTQTRRLATSPLRRVEVGDRLYVREAISCGGVFSDVVEVRYRAHERASHTEFVERVPLAQATSALPAWPKYRPSIHMPRWASRLTLVVEAVKIEALQMLEGQHPLESEALAEGVHRIHHGDGDYYYSAFRDHPDPHNWTDPADAFRELWNSLHTSLGERWEDNPDVVALTFRVEHGNIDTLSLENARG